MTCRHCQTINADDAHRCLRCGRRLAGFARPAPDDYNAPAFPTLGSMALEPEGNYQSAGVAEAPQIGPSPEVHRLEYQRALFSGAHRVMELPVPVARPKRQNTAASTRRSRTDQHRKVTVENGAQQSLVFEDLAAQESVPLIYCDAPVANPIHRATAAFLDASMIVTALGLFMVTFELCGGRVVLDMATAPLYGGILVVLALFYKLLFCVCAADTPGMVWTQLRLLNFDGHIPDRDERIQRMFGSFLSYAVGGLGMVWAMVDEEKLAWHDHISKTFPTPYYR